jgi:hypothetical protein
MEALEPRDIDCPYCGESIEVYIDTSVLPQQYIEDCQVCCRPINFDISEDYEGDVTLRVGHEND